MSFDSSETLRFKVVGNGGGDNAIVRFTRSMSKASNWLRASIRKECLENELHVDILKSDVSLQLSGLYYSDGRHGKLEVGEIQKCSSVIYL